MNFRTLLAKLVSFFKKEAAHLKLTRLQDAIHDDYTAVVQKADAALQRGEAEVVAIAHKELAQLEALAAAAKRRAENLLATYVLHGAHEERAQAVAGK